MKYTAFLVLASLATGAAAQDDFAFDVPVYQEQAAEAGIAHDYTGAWEFFVGGGAASFDCNGDRLPDLVAAGGEGAAQLYINQSTQGSMLSFETRPFLDGLTDVTGAYPLHLDDDGILDLAVLRVGQNVLAKGGPDCSFEDASAAFGLNTDALWTTAFAAIWEADNTQPTLAFGNYVDRAAPGTPFGTCSDNHVLRPSETGYGPVTALSPSHCSLSLMFTDWQNTGQYDLRVTNDRQYHRGGQEQLWNMSGGATPVEYGSADGWQKLVIWGMGIAQADLDGDGKPEYALSSMGDTMLQTLDQTANTAQPMYRDIAFDAGATAHRPYTGGDIKPSTGWHTQFADVNNDARTDLFIAKGNVARMSDFAAFDPDNLLLGDGNGGFVEQGTAAGIALDTKGRGAVVDDFNADGMLDLFVVNRDGPATLFRNMGRKTDWGTSPMGNFIGIELDNGDVNPRGVGAVISVKTGNLTQTQTVQIGGGHASGQAGFTHFGLGVAERATVRVKWPDGGWSQPYRVFGNNFVVLDKERSTAKYWFPPKAD